MPLKNNSNKDANNNNAKKRRSEHGNTTSTIIATSTVINSDINIFQQIPLEILFPILNNLDFISFYRFLSICKFTYTLYENSQNQSVIKVQNKLRFFKSFGIYLSQNEIRTYIALDDNFEMFYKEWSTPKSPMYQKVFEYTQNQSHEELQTELKNTKISCMFTIKGSLSPLAIASGNGDLETIELLLGHEINLGESTKNLNSEEALQDFFYSHYEIYFTTYFLPAIDVSFKAKVLDVSRFFLKYLLHIMPFADYLLVLDLSIKYSATEAIHLLFERDTNKQDLYDIKPLFIKNLNVSEKVLEILNEKYGNQIDEKDILKAINEGNKRLVNFYCQKRQLSLGKLVIKAFIFYSQSESNEKNYEKFYLEMTPDQQDELVFQTIWYQSELTNRISKLKNISVEALILKIMKKRPDSDIGNFFIQEFNKDSPSPTYTYILVYLILKKHIFIVNSVPIKPFIQQIAEQNNLTSLICFFIQLDAQTVNNSTSNDQETEALITIIKEYFSLIYPNILKIINEAIGKKHKPLIELLRQLHADGYFTTNEHINDQNPLQDYKPNNPNRNIEQLTSLRRAIDSLFIEYELEETDKNQGFMTIDSIDAIFKL